MTLEGLRNEIDRIDERILSLLEERMEKTLLTRAFKPEGPFDPKREEAVFERARRPVRRLVSPEFAEGIYVSVMAESKAIQDRGMSTIGFQGDHGAWSEVAARSWDEELATIPCREFVDIFDAVRDGHFDYGIVPVENTLGGLIGPVNAILVYADLRIVAAVDLPVAHCLLALPNTDHREIRQVYSHTQALAQCRGFLARNHLDAMPWFDTAGAARMIAEERPRAAAVLASRLAGELYGLEVIKEGVQDSDNNRTRFFVLARQEDGERLARGRKGRRQKCSAVFHAEDKAGALFSVLEVFTRAGINLTRIESVPDRPGDYAIFIDFEGDEAEEGVARAIADASRAARGFRILGCYDETRP
jgi:prephenate dehydratase/chorismate mutase/prephenate dehydratase